MFDDLFSDSILHKDFKPIVNDDFEVLIVGEFSSLRFFIYDGGIRSLNQVFDVTVTPANKFALSI